MQMRLRKHYTGCYRLSYQYDDPTDPFQFFAQIRKVRGGWAITILRTDTPNLRSVARYAGIWRTLKEAKEEAKWVLNHM